jgi:hypothetical protein
MTDDRLAFLLRAPALVETVVRRALRRALRTARLRGEAPDVRAFANLALSELHRALANRPAPHDPLARHELDAATVRAATAFASSTLARRLFALPAERFAEAPPEVDAAVRDARGGLHFVRLETFASDDARLRAVPLVVRAASGALAADAPSLHFFSLRDGRRRSYASLGLRAARYGAGVGAPPALGVVMATSA